MPDIPGRLRAGLAGRYAIERELGRGGWPRCIWLRTCANVVELNQGNAINKALLAYTYAKLNRRDPAERLRRSLDHQARTTYASGTAIAVAHAGLGDTTAAFHWLQRALEARDPLLLYFFIADPILDGLKRMRVE
jgi:hypothetical protein